MRKTITPERKEYDSTFGNSYPETNYGKISSFNNGNWYHYSKDELDNWFGETWRADNMHIYEFNF